jgi:hypothetical protein
MVCSEGSQSHMQVRLPVKVLYISFIFGPVGYYVFPPIACLVSYKVTNYANEPTRSVATYAVPSTDFLTSCLLTATVDF